MELVSFAMLSHQERVVEQEEVTFFVGHCIMAEESESSVAYQNAVIGNQLRWSWTQHSKHAMHVPLPHRHFGGR